MYVSILWEGPVIKLDRFYRRHSRAPLSSNGRTSGSGRSYNAYKLLRHFYIPDIAVANKTIRIPRFNSREFFVI